MWEGHEKGLASQIRDLSIISYCGMRERPLDDRRLIALTASILFNVFGSPTTQYYLVCLRSPAGILSYAEGDACARL